MCILISQRRRIPADKSNRHTSSDSGSLSPIGSRSPSTGSQGRGFRSLPYTLKNKKGNFSTLQNNIVHSREKPHRCKICKKEFELPNTLKVHMRSHTGERPFQCNICDKRFICAGHLTEHMRTHTGERPFKCNLCKMRFTQSSNLHNHRVVHTGEKPHHCRICKKQFSIRKNLTDHLRTHTGERPFKCNVCKKSFANKTTLKNHYLLHTGEKPYQCDICNKRFSQHASLHNHKLVHTKERPYTCGECKHKFKSLRVLRQHWKRSKCEPSSVEERSPNDSNGSTNVVNVVKKRTGGQPVNGSMVLPYKTAKSTPPPNNTAKKGRHPSLDYIPTLIDKRTRAQSTAPAGQRSPDKMDSSSKDQADEVSYNPGQLLAEEEEELEVSSCEEKKTIRYFMFLS